MEEEKVMFLYRYEDVSYSRYGNNVKIEELKFKVIRETPRGFWIKRSYDRNFFHFEINGEKDKWVSKTAFKRYAYPTREEAMVNFKARKVAQIRILEHQLNQARNAFIIVDRGTINVESVDTFLKYEDMEINL